MDPDDIFDAIVCFIIDAHAHALRGERVALALHREQRARFDELSAWTDSGRPAPRYRVYDGVKYRWNPYQHCVETSPADRADT